MRRTLLLALLALASCSGGDEPSLTQPSPTPEDESFRVLEEGQNGAFCVEGPEFALARDEDEWIDVYSRQSDCQPDGDLALPAVRFDAVTPEVALAAWWRVEGCLGFTVQTQAVQRVGAEVVVRATSTGPSPGQACATALGALESFLAVPASAVEGASTIRFVLDGEQLGAIEV